MRISPQSALRTPHPPSISRGRRSPQPKLFDHVGGFPNDSSHTSSMLLAEPMQPRDPLPGERTVGVQVGDEQRPGAASTFFQEAPQRSLPTPVTRNAEGSDLSQA